jgi:glycosyltransferase involved in cell wall biosynthesis
VRVLHIQKVRGIGGSERHLLALLPALARTGIEVHMCALTAGDSAAFTRPMERAGVATSRIAAGPRFNPLLAPELLKIIHQLGPDLIHTHLVHADLYGLPAARVAGVPAVSSAHGTPAFYRRTPLRQAARAVGRIPTWRIAISEHVRSFLVDLGISRSERIQVIHYGLDAGSWQESEAGRWRARESLGLDPSDVAVGIAARLIDGKGHRTLIQAVQRARATRPSVKLLVAGTGPLLEELRAEVGPDDAVRLLGFVDDVPSFMAACDVCAATSDTALSEGFGLSALEAMAAGRPVVATRVGSLPEVVTPETGLLVRPDDVDELASALGRLADDGTMRAELGRAGARRARRLFSLERMVQQTVDLYGTIVD